MFQSFYLLQIDLINFYVRQFAILISPKTFISAETYDKHMGKNKNPKGNKEKCKEGKT